MANRRMFSRRIIGSTRFLKMPISSQALYFHLGMNADDDGVVEAYPVIKMAGCSEDDLRVLVAKNFVQVLNEDLVAYITDWGENNKIRADRKIDSIYKNLLIKVNPGNQPAESVHEIPMSDKCRTNDGQMSTKCQPNDGIGKDRLGKDKIISVSKDTDCPTNVRRSEVDIVKDEWNSLQSFGIKPISKINDNTQRYVMLKARLSQYGLDDVLKAISNVKISDFLQGKSGKKPFILTFDWFIRPNNFPKVLEGNYSNKTNDSSLGEPEEVIDDDFLYDIYGNRRQ